ncbi:hypothetical protein LTR85_004969 [Meristemomyces frigidus]|nr:hypothetical protein LTR85_004969 [Meristemomyces frigidus]
MGRTVGEEAKLKKKDKESKRVEKQQKYRRSFAKDVAPLGPGQDSESVTAPASPASSFSEAEATSERPYSPPSSSAETQPVERATKRRRLEPQLLRAAPSQSDSDEVFKDLDLLPQYRELRRYQPTLKEAFALDEAFTAELTKSAHSMIFYENDNMKGSFVVKDTFGNGFGGRQAINREASQLYERLISMEMSGQIADQEEDSDSEDEADDEGPLPLRFDDVESLMEIFHSYRKRKFELFKEVQHVYAEHIVKAAKAKGITYAPTGEEVEAARLPHPSFYADSPWVDDGRGFMQVMKKV